MEKRSYNVRFNTPAFLGNAEKTGQWRTPPFKALLRQWWRIAYAAGRHNDPDLVTEMRRDEGILFGVAADKSNGSRRSQVRIRLSKWRKGEETKTIWGEQELLPGLKVKHLEVQKPMTNHNRGDRHASFG